MNTTTTTTATVRPLSKDDLDAVVALDREGSGESRRGYFQKRLAAALRWPKRHLQIAARDDQGLVGFLLARQAGGEYGRPEAAVVLEAVGVAARARRAGVGQAMVAELVRLMHAREIRALVTQVDWHNHSMLRFLDAGKFRLAPRSVLERRVHRMPLPETDEEIEQTPPTVRVLRESDYEQVVRIDARITGQDRGEYLRRKFDEALNESAITVSLVVEDDGFVVGFAMARVDFGDFGHVGATAALDTLGVHPGFAHKGLARALLTQMVDNLAALHVERLETEVSADAFELLRFLHRFGFAPGQRLVFQRGV